ncbi:MAG: BatD family protein [Myxococcota bacterium]
MPSRLGIGAGLLAVCALFGAAPASAKSLSVSASLSQDRLYVGEVVTLEVVAVATADGNVEIDVPEVPGLEELRRGHSDSTSISWNGSAQTLRRERILRVDFEAKKSGALTIPPIAARLGSDEEHTPALSLNILPNGQDEPSASAPAGRVATPGEVQPPEPDEKDIFVRYRADRAKAYVGEQIIVDLEVFTSGAYNLDETKPPISPDGFWREILEQADRMTARTEKVGSRTYRVYRLWRIALFPLSPGEKQLPTSQLSFSQNRSIFSVGQRIRRTAPPIKLEALALPEQGKPREFVEGNVGVYTFEAKVDTTEVEPGKGVVLTLSLGGAGNVSSAKLPDVKAVDGFRVFPAKVSDDIARSATGVTGTKRAEILLVPTRGGRLVIPPFTVAVMNPDKKDYERLTTAEIPVHVQGTPSVPAGAKEPQASAGLEDERKLSLRPIRLKSRIEADRRRFLGSPLFWVGVGAPPVAYALALGLLGFFRRRPVESESARARRITMKARADLGAAEAQLTGSELARAYGTMSEAILALASERAGKPLRGLTLAELEKALEEAGAAEDLAGHILEILRRADFGRFAPGGGDPRSARATLELARATLEELEAWEVRDAS